MSSSADPVLHDRLRLSSDEDRGADVSFAFDFPRSPKMRMKVYRRSLIKMVREKDVDGALALYTEATRLGCQTTEGMFNTILNLCGDSGKTMEGMQVLAEMRAAGFRPRENTCIFLLKEASARGSFEEAFATVRDMADKGVTPRLRSYAPLLSGLLEQANEPNMALAAQVWSHMKAQGVQPTELYYVGMIKGWAKARQLWDRVRDGSVDRLFGELSNNAFEFAPAAEDPGEPGPKVVLKAKFVDALMEAFNSDVGHERVCRITHISGSGVCECCGRQLRAVGVGPQQRLEVRHGLLAMAAESAVRGRHCGVVLSAMAAAASGRTTQLGQEDEATEEEKREMLAEMDNLEAEVEREFSDPNDAEAVDGVESRGVVRGGWGRRVGAGGDLEHFAGWLEEGFEESSGGFTTVLDACNIAYYGQNIEGGHFRIAQVDDVVKLLEAEGERVLVLLPERYLQPVVPNTTSVSGGRSNPTSLDAEAIEVIEDWESRGMLYSCTSGAEDDLFGMYFTFASDDPPHVRDGGQDIPPELAREGNGGIGAGGASDDRAQGRRRVRRTLVTNDMMRDHCATLLTRLPYIRWREAQVRNFHLTSGDGLEVNVLRLHAKDAGDTDSDDEEVEADVEEGEGGDEMGGDLVARRKEGVSESEVEIRRALSRAVLPLPLRSGRAAVARVRAYTRDMQHGDGAWHVPIRNPPGENRGGTAWLCIDLAAGLSIAERSKVEKNSEANQRDGGGREQAPRTPWWGKLAEDLIQGVTGLGSIGGLGKDGVP